MRTAFRGYYAPSKEELAEIWDDGLLILDTNALLNLFRYSQRTRDDFIRVLRTRAACLWLPHQVGLEFHRRRLDVINQQNTAFDEIEKALVGAKDGTQKALKKFERHPSLDTADLAKKVESSLDEIAELVAAARDKHAETVLAGEENEHTFAEITDLYDGRVGAPYGEERLAELCKVGASRYEKKIPPGYADGQKPEPDRYGDLIIWEQILEKGRELSRPAMFVTDDGKEDWWQKSNGKTIGPRVELVAEYHEAAGARVHFYSPERFLGYANEQGSSVSNESLTEVEQVSTARGTARATALLTQRRDQLLSERDSLEHRLRRLDDRGRRDYRRRQAQVHLAELEARLSDTERVRYLLEEELRRNSHVTQSDGHAADADRIARLDQLRAERVTVEQDLLNQRRELEQVAREFDQSEPERVERMAHSLYARATAVEEELAEVTQALADLDDGSKS